METKIYTVPEVAGLLRVSDRHVYEQVKQNKLKAIRIGHTLRITSICLDEYIQRGGVA